VARDAAGHETTASETVTVANDNAAPTVTLNLTPGATVAGAVSLLAVAGDDIGVVGVQFKIDGVAAGPEATAAPYELMWNTAGLANGSHTVSAVARDAAGHETSTSVVVNVLNDSAPPVVTLSLEADAVVAATVPIAAVASDDIGVTGVQLLVDGVLMGTELTAAPYGMDWNTLDVLNGSHTITAIARDAAGHEATTSVAVTVANP
jgi:hypothetical protein